MKILYIHQYFNKPGQSAALRSYYLGRALINAGHTVELITAYNGSVYYQENVNGIRVHYLPVAYDSTYGFAQRIISFLKFTWQGIRLAWRIKHIDLCYATSTPLTVGIIPLILKHFKQIPFYFEVRDLWPEAPVQMGIIRNKLLIKLLYFFEKYIYRQADKIITLSPGIEKGVLRHKPAQAVAMIPNIANTSFFTTQSPARSHFQDTFNIGYFGAIGQANQLKFLLNIAHACQKQNLLQIRFYIAGHGAEAEKLKNSVQALELNNVTWLGKLNRLQVRDYLAIAHATYTSFAFYPVLETNSPNKFFDSLAAGKLTIVNTKGWLTDLVQQHNCGFYADPFQPDEFIKQILPFLHHPVMLQRAQQHARKLAETTFSEQVLTRQFVTLFSK